jgi:hypothetical protein
MAFGATPLHQHLAAGIFTLSPAAGVGYREDADTQRWGDAGLIHRRTEPSV